MTKRGALVLVKGTEPGVGANVASILWGQLALASPDVYAEEPPLDASGVPHAGIRFSVVVLTGTQGKLQRLASDLSDERDVQHCCFSRMGQGLNNEFETYRSELASQVTPELLGVGLVGPDDRVRDLTKQFSMMKG